MSYQNQSDIIVDDHPVAAVEEVETIDLSISSNRNYDHNVIVVDDATQSSSTVAVHDENGKVSSTTPSRKRVRLSLKESTPKRPKIYDEDIDDGSICSICLDSWEIDGEHRLVSLKCGHLFGESCIRRWISECLSNAKTCPTCKRKATIKEIRCIYAKRVFAIDKSEENGYKKKIEEERALNNERQKEIGRLQMELKLQREKVDVLEREVEVLKRSRNFGEASSSSTIKPKTYKLFMEKNIEISREGGCKVMVYGKRVKSLIVTQKSIQTLFPGYGIRFIDSTTFRPSQFLHVSTKQIRDLSLDMDEEHLLTTSLDKGAKLINLQQRRAVSVFAPDDKVFWAAAFDYDRPKTIYLGAQLGGCTYVYDIRNPQTFVDELKIDGDSSPVIKICTVGTRDDFPFGGFFVCKLNSVWFYEYTNASQIVGTKLAVDGPFVSMSYEQQSQLVLISTRPSINYTRSRYIIAELMKIEGTTSIRIWGTCMGSTVQSVISRSTQVNVGEKNSIVAAYLEDVKSLSTWIAPSCAQMPSATLNEAVLDLCPMYLNGNGYLSALTENKCRIYRLQVVNGGSY